MAVVPHTIDIVVADLPRALGFYRALGLPMRPVADGAEQTQIDTPGGAALGLVAEALVRRAMPHWVTPVGQRVTFACRCDSAAEVDAVWARVTATYPGRRAPWDAPWGQRYAFLEDPDGNRVDLFAELGAAA